ncbi:hypothetical protein CYMTET_53528, partial [Cymbomonas tetramitiformis]
VDEARRLEAESKASDARKLQKIKAVYIVMNLFGNDNKTTLAEAAAEPNPNKGLFGAVPEMQQFHQKVNKPRVAKLPWLAAAGEQLLILGQGIQPLQVVGQERLQRCSSAPQALAHMLLERDETSAGQMRDLLSLLPLEARLQLAARQLGPDVATWGTWGDFGHFSYREEEAEEAARRERVRTLLRELQSQARQKSKLQELPALRGLQAQQAKMEQAEGALQDSIHSHSIQTIGFNPPGDSPQAKMKQAEGLQDSIHSYGIRTIGFIPPGDSPDEELGIPKCHSCPPELMPSLPPKLQKRSRDSVLMIPSSTAQRRRPQTADGEASGAGVAGLPYSEYDMPGEVRRTSASHLRGVEAPALGSLHGDATLKHVNLGLGKEMSVPVLVANSPATSSTARTEIVRKHGRKKRVGFMSKLKALGVW